MIKLDGEARQTPKETSQLGGGQGRSTVGTSEAFMPKADRRAQALVKPDGCLEAWGDCSQTVAVPTGGLGPGNINAGVGPGTFEYPACCHAVGP